MAGEHPACGSGGFMNYTYTCRVSSPLGMITLASDGTGITGLWIEGQKYFAAKLKEDTVEKELPVFDETKRWLQEYFSGKEPDFVPLLTPSGSPFSLSVWKLLREIPYGSLTTYGRIAASLGRPRACQAVGNAVGHNPISILIPCHRVVGTGGSLTGYAGGIDKKIKLLELEKAPMEGLYWPKKN